MDCPGIGNYKRPRISRGISHASNMVTLQTLELLQGWKSWRWEIWEVPLQCLFCCCAVVMAVLLAKLPSKMGLALPGMFPAGLETGREERGRADGCLVCRAPWAWQRPEHRIASGGAAIGGPHRRV